MKNALTVLSSTEAPTMSSVEMVEYINALAAAADKADSIQELDKCLRLIEDFRRSVSVSYHPICKVIYCHVNSLICQKIADCQSDDYEQGVYVIEFDDGFVKIGMTATSFSKRMQTISHQTAAKILRAEFIECDMASKVESDLHRHLAAYRGNGEFFKVDFDGCLSIAKAWATKCQGKKKK